MLGWLTQRSELQRKRRKKYGNIQPAFYRETKEFVLLMTGPVDRELGTLVDHLRNEIRTAQSQSGLALSAAIGYSLGNAANLSALLKEADDMMYADKAAMKVEAKERR